MARTKEMAWMPVSEQLPNCVGDYLVTIGTGENARTTRRFFDGVQFRIGCLPVIAWMPVPDPYKGGEAND